MFETRLGSLLVPLRPSLRVGSFASQDLSIFLRSCCGSFSRRIAEADIFPSKLPKKDCGDLRRRRIHTKLCRRNSKCWLVKFPSWSPQATPPRPTWVAVKPIMFTPSFAQSVRKKCRKGYFASRISENRKIGSQSEEQDSRAGFSENQCFLSFRHSDRTKWRSMGDFDSQDFDRLSTSFAGVIARTLRDWQR